MLALMRVVPIPCLRDNYAYLVICEDTWTSAVVDPSEPGPVLAALEAERSAAPLEVRAIWATHHHLDHVGGIEALADALLVSEVVGFEGEMARIPRLSRPLEDGAAFALGGVAVQVLHVPGHTRGALAYLCQVPGEPPSVFTGDTLFLAGCGRLFEGTPAQMHASFARLSSLPDETRIYCGHEYTLANLAFAAHCEPDNEAIAVERARIAGLRDRGLPSMPGLLGTERRTSPFLRVSSPSLRRTLGVPEGASDVEAFAAARSAKDVFVAP